MRLYVNKKEVPFLKNALIDVINRTATKDCLHPLQALLERIELCEKLQDNVRKSHESEIVSFEDTITGEVITNESY